MWLKKKYLCTNTESYCQKGYFFCPERCECRWHYLAKRKAWYSKPSNQRRLFARLKSAMGESAANKRFLEILEQEKQQKDITIGMLSGGASYFCCLSETIVAQNTNKQKEGDNNE